MSSFLPSTDRACNAKKICNEIRDAFYYTQLIKRVNVRLSRIDRHMEYSKIGAEIKERQRKSADQRMNDYHARLHDGIPSDINEKILRRESLIDQENIRENTKRSVQFFAREDEIQNYERTKELEEELAMEVGLLHSQIYYTNNPL